MKSVLDRITAVPQRALDATFAFFLGDPRARVKSYGVCGPKCIWPERYSEYRDVPINYPHGDCE